MKTEGVDEAGLPVQQYQIKQFEDIVKAQEQSNLFKKAEIENFTQKSLLDKNHQERYLQELVDYAGKRRDINKVRVPTSETAAKVQGYRKEVNPLYPEAKTKILNLEAEIKKHDDFFKEAGRYAKYIVGSLTVIVWLLIYSGLALDDEVTAIAGGMFGMMLLVSYYIPAGFISKSVPKEKEDSWSRFISGSTFRQWRVF